MSTIKAPAHLSAASAAWFQEVALAFDLSGDHVRVLTMACEAWDLAQEARALLADEGIVVTSETGVRKSHPAVAILNSASDRFLKAVSMLGLADDDVPQAIPGGRQHVRVVK